MTKDSAIKALQTGVSEGISLIEYLRQKYGDQDPIIDHALEQLRTVLKYSEHIYDEHPSKKHQIYDN